MSNSPLVVDAASGSLRSFLEADLAKRAEVCVCVLLSRVLSGIPVCYITISVLRIWINPIGDECVYVWFQLSVD